MKSRPPLPRVPHTAMSRLSLPLLLLLALTACQKDLVRWPYYQKTHFTVAFDWTAAPSAQPSEMMLVMFAENGGRPLDYGFAGHAGGQLDLAAGNYKALAYNGDTETLTGLGTTWENYELTTHEVELSRVSPLFASRASVPRAEGAEDEPVILQPDMAWTGAVTEILAGEHERETATLPMRPAVYTYTINISQVKNLGYVTNISATISGMSSSMHPATGRPTENHGTIPVTLSTDSRSSITATFRSFGHCPSEEIEAGHVLVVYARLVDGSKWYYEVNVTSALHDADHVAPDETGRNVEIPIEVSGIPFPKPFTNGSGMHPDVEDWMEVEEDVFM